MATKKVKTPNVAEEALAKKLEAFRKAHPKPTDKQKEDIAEMKAELGQMKFVRIANLRVPRALAMVRNIGNLSGAGYKSTAPQQAAIVKALKDAASEVERKLAGTKEAKGGFELPLAEDEEKGDAA